MLQCLDFFINNQLGSNQQKIEKDLTDYSNKPKDWKYYFMKYPSFRDNCNQGYYSFKEVGDYCIFKMKERQFNGWHWDPFLQEIAKNTKVKNLSIDNLGGKLVFSQNRKKILISSVPKGFLFENGMSNRNVNTLLDEMKKNGIIDGEGFYFVSQTEDLIDLQDRIELLHKILIQIGKK